MLLWCFVTQPSEGITASSWFLFLSMRLLNLPAGRLTHFSPPDGGGCLKGAVSSQTFDRIHVRPHETRWVCVLGHCMRRIPANIHSSGVSESASGSCAWSFLLWGPTVPLRLLSLQQGFPLILGLNSIHLFVNPGAQRLKTLVKLTAGWLEMESRPGGCWSGEKVQRSNMWPCWLVKDCLKSRSLVVVEEI